jgi:glycine/D-amino acid oxidase-like deaminating enzyme
MKLPHADVVIIGGGAVGAACAWALTKAGKRVTLVERKGLAHEASGANVGLVTLFSAYSFDEPDPGAMYGLTRESIDTYTSLGDSVGMDIEYDQVGGVAVAMSPGKLDVLRRPFEGYQRHGVPLQWLGPAEVRDCEPAFKADGVVGGVF